MQFYKNFIGYPTDQHFEEFSGSDTKEAFEESLITKPDDWYYRTHPISYIRNSNGHRCKELDNLDLNNYILYAGCSYTEGTGLELEKTYSYLVSNDLGTDYYNLALGGTGVDVTSYNLIQWNNLVKANPKALVIQWPSVVRYGVINKNNVDILDLIGPWEKTRGVGAFLTIGGSSSVPYFLNKKLILQRLIKSLFTCPVIEFEISEFNGKLIDHGRDPHPGIKSNRYIADTVKKRILDEIR